MIAPQTAEGQNIVSIQIIVFEEHCISRLTILLYGMPFSFNEMINIDLSWMGNLNTANDF